MLQINRIAIFIRSGYSVEIEFRSDQVLIFGAAQGIGRVIARSFANAGAQVLACDLLVAEVEAMSGPVGPGFIRGMSVDVTSEASVQAVVQAAQAKGRIDIVVYVAGGVCGQRPTPVECVSRNAWEAIVDVNLTGAFLVARAVVPSMKSAGGGRIVTISSRAGLSTSLTGIQSYAAAKHGQVGLVKQLAQELAPFNITVNSVAPGFMNTNPDAQKQWEGYSPEFRESFLNGVVGRRMGTPEDIAHAVMFLASPFASWITGQVLPVTGAPT